MSIEEARNRIRKAKIKNNKKLDLSFCYLNNDELLKLLPDICKIEQLESLNLGSNKLSNLSFPKKLYKIKSLNLSRNKLTNIEFINDFTHLQSLFLDFNQIIGDCSFEPPASLKELSLNSNQINRLDFIKNLNCSHKKVCSV